MKKPLISAIAAAVVIGLSGCSVKPNTTLAETTNAKQIQTASADTVAAQMHETSMHKH